MKTSALRLYIGPVAPISLSTALTPSKKFYDFIDRCNAKLMLARTPNTNKWSAHLVTNPSEKPIRTELFVQRGRGTSPSEAVHDLAKKIEGKTLSADEDGFGTVTVSSKLTFA